jgi:uncharacterized protein
VVAFTHEPDDVRSSPSRVSVTFASRVHGVIARLPRLASPIVASWHDGRYRVGHTVEGGRHLYVTTGVGASVLPAHIGPQPEVAIVTVRAAGVDAVDAPESPPSGGAHH